MRIIRPYRRGARSLCLSCVLSRAIALGEGEPGWICGWGEETVLGLGLEVAQQRGGWCGGRQFSPHGGLRRGSVVKVVLSLRRENG